MAPQSIPAVAREEAVRHPGPGQQSILEQTHDPLTFTMRGNLLCLDFGRKQREQTNSTARGPERRRQTNLTTR